ncbi:MAG: 3'-5' exonuclease, partial [Pseudomonadota bacterium]|nr:3'-5' exonuclease [Pseudomonadota bacterium]
AKLNNEEQKAVKTTAFDLQMNSANPGLEFHKLDRVRDPKFWSVRVSRDIRLIVHKSQDSLLLCYVAHHDPAYHWAERRKLETHPKTGAAQLVEVREMVREITVPKYAETAQPVPPKPLLFSDLADDELLGYGVPAEWLHDVRAANEDSVLELADHLPGEAAEALLDLATGVTPQIPQPTPPDTAPFDHPDAQRRFRLMSDVEELSRALDYPWEKWTVFLHPTQRQLVERDYSGPARISGSAGTGKTIVALHRAVFLARNHPDARVLLTTFSDALANMLKTKLKRLISNEPRLGERIDVYAMNALGERLYEMKLARPSIASEEEIGQLLEQASSKVERHKFSQRFLRSEWAEVVDAWQLDSWEAYRDVKRLGRKTRLPEKQRALLWSIFEQVKTDLANRNLITHAEMFTRLASAYVDTSARPFDFTVVDEAQDVSIAQLRFLATLAADRPDGLFFSGDLGQRIFQQPFSWKALGVDVRGRSRTLHINYRTSHQIRSRADRLLAPELSDVDGNAEDRRGTISVFNGPKPQVLALDDETGEPMAVGQWLRDRIQEGVTPHEIGIFVRSEAQLDRARDAAEEAKLASKILDEHVEVSSGFVSLSTMHLAKGLEFRTVVVMACDDEVIPLQERIETVTDDTDLEEVYNTERHLLYVACTRARDHLLVTGVAPVSEYLDDFRA